MERYTVFQISGIAESRTVFLNGERLTPERSQRIINHSPDGFAWGYGGSGPSQLALAIVIEVFSETAFISRRLKEDVLSKIPMMEDFNIRVLYDERDDHFYFISNEYCNVKRSK